MKKVIILLFLPILFLGFSKNITPSYAFSCSCELCTGDITNCSSYCGCESNNKTKDTIDHIQEEFVDHQEWLVKTVLEEHVFPAMLMMANQISAAAMQQTMVIGTFFDAKHQLETQRLHQDLQTQAHKDYHPSTGMCRFGTNTRSLAVADGNVTLNQIAFAARNTQRNLMTAGAVGTGSARDDSRSRFAQFKAIYCNPADFGNSLQLICRSNDVARFNKDINFTNNIQDEETLSINFSNTVVTPDEEDALALSANLYGPQLMSNIPDPFIAKTDGTIIESGAYAYMKTRAIAAKRSVAFNSFAAQAAMRSEGGGTVLPYMTEILEEMGIKEDNINSMLKGSPSYNAQMEILTKKLYQNPTFYSDLYDKPVNVDRKDVAMQAIALMQQRDIYRSQLRSEANMSVWLETAIEELQNNYTRNQTTAAKEGKILFDLGLD